MFGSLWARGFAVVIDLVAHDRPCLVSGSSWTALAPFQPSLEERLNPSDLAPEANKRITSDVTAGLHASDYNLGGRSGH